VETPPDKLVVRRLSEFEKGNYFQGQTVRREPISKSCEITQADNLNRRRRLSRKV